jgi:excinuclease UvrABC helicase subunit UvrB
MYADQMTGSMQSAIDETNRRRRLQMEYNKQNNITPQTIINEIDEVLSSIFEADYVTVDADYVTVAPSSATIRVRSNWPVSAALMRK